MVVCRRRPQQICSPPAERTSASLMGKSTQSKQDVPLPVASAPNIPAASSESDKPYTNPTTSIEFKMATAQKPFGCLLCKRAFATKVSLNQHHRSYHSWPCPTCSVEHSSNQKLQNHQRAQNHCFCRECNQYFSNEAAVKAHNNTVGHVSQFHCCDCERDFVTEQALDQHLDGKVHKQIACQICQQTLGGYKSLESHVVKVHQASANPKRILYPENFNTCYVCQRRFVDKKALDQHLVSLRHHPLSDIRCVASTKCKRRFTSPSALLGHLVSGACCSGICRQDIHRLVRNHDTERLISSGPMVYNHVDQYSDGSDASSSSSGTPILTPTSSASNSPILTPCSLGDAVQHLIGTIPQLPAPSATAKVTTEYSRRLSDGRLQAPKGPLRCPLCPNKTKVFRSRAALDDHLSSPNHSVKMFHCPSNLLEPASGKTTTKYFSTLSGLAQHVESGACGDGMETMRKAMGFIQGKLEDMGFGGVRLLK